jgi:hypothetical protein
VKPEPFRVVAQLFFGWWHSEKVTVEGIAGTNHQWWWQQQENDSYSFASIRIWPSRHWW